MRWFALALSLLPAILGAVGVVWPGALLGLARHFQTPAGLYAAGALRIVLGGALFLAAPGSRAPRTIRAIGILILIAGIATPFFGVERSRGILESGSSQPVALVRVLAGIALSLGCFLTWALLPANTQVDS
jgi:hypothetical protein